ncbi:glycoside hydrolase family 13 protein [Mycobacterium shinjukuense]|uniref:Alpha-glucosidase AglA n=1 Tax=Mycobacterium shinjukuense TaxID=398694 RepID=A0A7I7MQ55_9MYCO|nr:glycoside hydrolase family 13 protein [Mycobacterium shinjukuense]MCV6985647.1 glycoside hydrolase family 13 protein [Mycobacterium shinjukuense]BBX74368.1 alpha-glucosidase AglA [Mycobacterium shinjukuense]
MPAQRSEPWPMGPGSPRARARRPEPWWSDAVFYQVYPRSFADSNGDGVGDLDGITGRLRYLEALGVDAIWINPVTVSPMADHGYDVANPRDIDPLFGGMSAFDRLIAAAHRRGIKVTMDVVPNHTSSAHPWFQAALIDGPGGAARDRYFFRDGRGTGGALPPNNWESVFGGPAWTRVVEPDGTLGQWYLHLFDTEQPDLNWDHPEVFDDFEKTLRFWLERGVDGFRIDVAHGMAKPPGLPDARGATGVLRHTDDDPRFNRPQVHAIHRDIRAVVDDYPGAVTIGEVWVRDNARWAEYVRPDELHLGFNFRLARAEFSATAIHDAVHNSLRAAALAGATPTWTLANHDVGREVTRYGGGELGLRRARAMAMVMLGLPGAVFLYNGQELGLPDVDLPDEVLQDPTWKRSGYTERGRDRCRVPIPWSGEGPPFGFSTSAETWLPMPADWAGLTVEKQRADGGSTLSFFRRALQLRSGRAEFDGDDIEWLTAPRTAVIFRRPGGLVCALNAGKRPLALPDGELILASTASVDGQLPPDSAAWLAT